MGINNAVLEYFYKYRWDRQHTGILNEIFHLVSADTLLSVITALNLNLLTFESLYGIKLIDEAKINTLIRQSLIFSFFKEYSDYDIQSTTINTLLSTYKVADYLTYSNNTVTVDDVPNCIYGYYFENQLSYNTESELNIELDRIYNDSILPLRNEMLVSDFSTYNSFNELDNFISVFKTSCINISDTPKSYLSINGSIPDGLILLTKYLPTFRMFILNLSLLEELGTQLTNDNNIFTTTYILSLYNRIINTTIDSSNFTDTLSEIFLLAKVATSSGLLNSTQDTQLINAITNIQQFYNFIFNYLSFVDSTIKVINKSIKTI